MALNSISFEVYLLLIVFVFSQPNLQHGDKNENYFFKVLGFFKQLQP